VVSLTTIRSISLLTLTFGCRAGVGASVSATGGGDDTGSTGGEDTGGGLGKTIVFSLSSSSALNRLSSRSVLSVWVPTTKLLSSEAVFKGLPNETVDKSPAEMSSRPISGCSSMSIVSVKCRMRAGAAGVCQNAASESWDICFDASSKDGMTGVDGGEDCAALVVVFVRVSFELGLDFDRTSFCPQY